MSQDSGNGETLFKNLRARLGDADDEALHAFLADLHAADVADCMEQVSEEERSRILFLLPPRTTAEAIVLLEEAVRSDVLEDFTSEQVSDVLKELPPDDAVDVLDELDDDIANRVVEHLSPEHKAIVEPLRRYDEDSAGGIMNTDFVDVPLGATVSDAVARIRSLTEDKHRTTYQIYCVDDAGKLSGVVPPMRLIASRPTTPIRDLLLSDLFTAQVDDDQEAVKNKFEKYDVVALPVLDADGRLVGVITHDDILEVAGEEAEEDLLHMAGTDAEEFASASVLRAAGVRARWLLPCLFGSFIGAVTAMYLGPKFPKGQIGFILPFLIPIAAMGGNTGVQISTVIVRAMGRGDAFASRFRAAAARELRIAGILALGTGVFMTACAWVASRTGIVAGSAAFLSAGGEAWRIASAVGLAMTFAILLSGTMGLTLPFLFRRIGIDPAIASGPLITTCNDAVSAAVYLLTALTLLGPH